MFSDADFISVQARTAFHSFFAQEKHWVYKHAMHRLSGPSLTNVSSTDDEACFLLVLLLLAVKCQEKKGKN